MPGFRANDNKRLCFTDPHPSGATDAEALAKITALTNIVEERRDCILFESPPRANVVGVANKTTPTIINQHQTTHIQQPCFGGTPVG